MGGFPRDFAVLKKAFTRFRAGRTSKITSLNIQKTRHL
jgi:hypothetical protein